MSRTSIPAAVIRCCYVLREAGHKAYPVGGCVRDLLLGRVPGDWDVTTSARPELVQSLFPHTVPTGIRHGTITVIEDEIRIEVTTFRKESEYSDSRHPDRVSFDTDLTGDLSRRDFTINAMAYGEDGQIIDPYGGMVDLESRLIRAVGVPEQRFSEDALRILRGIRFAAQLGFTVEQETMDAMKKSAALVDRVSPERIKTEMEKILVSPNPRWIALVVDMGILNRFYTKWPACDWEKIDVADAVPIKRWKAFFELTRFPVSALPIERAVRMAVLHPEREYIKALSLSGADLQRIGFSGELIGAAQRKLAEHIRLRPEDNEPERLIKLLEQQKDL